MNSYIFEDIPMLKHLLSSVSSGIIGLSGLLIAASLPFTAQAENLSVELNKTQVLHLPETASAVVIGNPTIADISIYSPNILFIVGRGYGYYQYHCP